MKKSNYDELQLKVRYKTATQCLGIIFALTFVNGFINEAFVWAMPSTQALVIIMFTTIYFIIVTTLKGAYISNKEKNPLVIIISFAIIAIVNLLVFVGGFSRIGLEYILKDNMLTSSSATLILAIFGSSASLVNLYKYLKIRNVIDE